MLRGEGLSLQHGLPGAQGVGHDSHELVVRHAFEQHPKALQGGQ